MNENELGSVKSYKSTTTSGGNASCNSISVVEFISLSFYFFKKKDKIIKIYIPSLDVLYEDNNYSLMTRFNKTKLQNQII